MRHFVFIHINNCGFNTGPLYPFASEKGKGPGSDPCGNRCQGFTGNGGVSRRLTGESSRESRARTIMYSYCRSAATRERFALCCAGAVRVLAPVDLLTTMLLRSASRGIHSKESFAFF